MGFEGPPPDFGCSLHCQAPADYLYLNDGRQATQILCKICSGLSPLAPRYRPRKTIYWCPYCQWALYRWKDRSDCTLYKCDNDRCPHYLQKKAALGFPERLLQKLRPSQFKLRYQYRRYHFTFLLPGPRKSSNHVLPRGSRTRRLGRTYKHHVRSACGFATHNGAVATTALFVTFYNFLRPHMALRNHPPKSKGKDPFMSLS